LILARLKSETGALHARLESSMPTLDELATLTSYRRCLRELHAVYAAWEPSVLRTDGLRSVISDADMRVKLPLLERDLRAMDVVADGDRVIEPRLELDGALGAMYVLEGATLGGQVIARHVAGPLGVTAERGLAFFSGYGVRTGPMWTQFGAALERWIANGGDADAVVAGAIRCFAAFEHRFAAAARRGKHRLTVTA
jgi:heme oxygenase